MDKEYKDHAESTLDRIIGWINNCDQKASILLAVIGVFLTFFTTSDYAKFIKHHLWDTLIEYGTSNNGILHTGRLISTILLICSFFFLCSTLYYLLNTIVPRTRKENDKKQKGKQNKIREIEITSKTFYKDIAKCNSFADFQKLESNYEKDIENQIWQNARICSKKFDNFENAIDGFRKFLVITVIFIISLLFV